MSRAGDRQAAAQLFAATAAAATAAAAAAGLWWRWRCRSPEAVLREALARLDSAHRAPFSEKGEADYCEAVERWVFRLRGLAGERVTPTLRLGARAQRLEAESTNLQRLLGSLDEALGHGSVERVRALVAKSLPLCPHPCSPRALGDLDGPPAGDAEMQCIEDAACLVFLEKELQDGFDDGKQDEQMVDVLVAAWKRMSRLAHAEALSLEYSPRMLGCAVEAIARAELAGGEDTLGGGEAPDAVPRPSAPTVALLAETWAEAERGGLGSFGEAWYEELRADPAFACDLGLVLNYPVCRARNVSRLVQLLIDLMAGRAEPPKAAAQRLHAVLRAATALSQRHAGLRLRHVDAMRSALVGAACRLTAGCGGGAPEERRRRNAWESFGFAVGAAVAPVLMLSDPGHDFCGAVATPLPTPGAGPCGALLAAHGAALLEMSVGLLRRRRAAAAAPEPEAAGLDRRAEEVAGRLAQIRAAACEAARRDAHAYCGLLAEAIFDAAGGDKEERGRRRAEWTRRCTELPLQVAALAAEAGRLGAEAAAGVRAGAPSVQGDLDTGLALLLTAGKVSLHTADVNMAGGSEMGALRERSGAIAASLAEVQSLVQA